MTPAEKKARNDALEEAAKLCDAEVKSFKGAESQFMRLLAMNLAYMIRALKDEI